MTKREILERVGSMQQLAYIRPAEYSEGRATGLKTWEVKNGPLTFQIAANKCLDMAQLSYKGANFTYFAKNGLQGLNVYDTDRWESVRGIMGGMFFTAGLANIGVPCTIDGRQYPLHGRIRSTPAEHMCADAYWDGDDYILRASGEMREASLFGENLVLRRTIETKYGSKTIRVRDVIENEGQQATPLMILYHCNFGYPLLDEGTELMIPSKCCMARDELAAGHEDKYGIMEAPKVAEPEYVFLHELDAPADGYATVGAMNHKLGLGMTVRFSRRNLPYFIQWKSIATGDYVVGLEPSNSDVRGRPYCTENNILHMIEPGAQEINELEFTVLDGEEDYAAAKKQIWGA